MCLAPWIFAFPDISQLGSSFPIFRILLLGGGFAIAIALVFRILMARRDD